MSVERDISDELLNLLDEQFDFEVVIEDKFQSARLAERGEYIRTWPGLSEHVSFHSDGETRDFNYEIFHFFDQKRYSKETDWNELFSEKLAEMRILLRDKNVIKYDNETIWHNLVLGESSPPMWVGEFEDVPDEISDMIYAIVHNITITRSIFQ